MTMAKQQLLDILKDLPDQVSVADFIAKIKEREKTEWNSKKPLRKSPIKIGAIVIKDPVRIAEREKSLALGQKPEPCPDLTYADPEAHRRFMQTMYRIVRS